MITTYYTPLEGSYPGGRTEEMRLRSGGSVYVKPGFRSEVRMEGWGRLGADHPERPDRYIGDPRPDGSAPGGHTFALGDCAEDRHGNCLVAYQSLATDQQTPEIPDGRHAGFHMVPGNGWPGGPVCGISVDVGSMIQGQHIDFYVGEHGGYGTGGPGAYSPVTTNGPVSVE